MINLSRLSTWLNQSNLQKTNQPAWQVIEALITAIKELQSLTVGTGGAGGTVPPGSVAGQQFLTWNNNLGVLPNSRQLIAGTGITLDDSVFGQRIISAAAGAGYWAPLTDGDVDETDLIFANGEAIMVFVPTP